MKTLDEWIEGRNAAETVEEKEKFNVWDNFFDHVLPVLQLMKQRKWCWFRNQQCKYIDVRIDMRDGGCIIRDQDGNRINPEDLALQIGQGGE